MPAVAACMNCGKPLDDQFCSACGQRKQRRLVSLFSLAGDFVSDLVNWDSRVWRTLWPLFFKPGLLTRAYLDGRREHYTPPVRMYLVSSIIFFLLISMSPRSFLSELSDLINFKAGGVIPGLEQGLDSPINSESSRAVINLINEKSSVGKGGAVILTSAPQRNGENDDDSADEATTPEDELIPSITLDDRVVIDVDALATELESPRTETQDDSTAESNVVEDELADSADTRPEDASAIVEDEPESGDIRVECGWISTGAFSPGAEFMRAPSQRFCESVSTWRGLINFLAELIDSLPKTLFVLLPLMALANKTLYLFSRRFYVEHLLYYVHNYSFLFLFTVVMVGITKAFELAGANAGNVIAPVGFLYVVYYFLKSMRVVYGQGWLLTIIKWIMLIMAFILLLSVVLVFYMLASAAMRGL